MKRLSFKSYLLEVFQQNQEFLADSEDFEECSIELKKETKKIKQKTNKVLAEAYQPYYDIYIECFYTTKSQG